MTLHRFALAAALLLGSAAPLAAKDTGGFVVRLGADTTGVETYVRTPGHLEVDQVGRSPRVMQRRLVYDFDAKGAITRYSILVTAPGAAPDAPPLQKIEGTCTADSMITVVTRGANTQTLRVAAPSGSVALATSSPWVMYEHALMRLAAGKPDTLALGLYYIGAGSLNHMHLKRLGRDSVEVTTDHEDVFRMRADKQGRLLGVRPIAGTGKFSAERVENLDLASYANAWSAAEKAAGAMGALSTRDTVKVSAGGAALWIDYGRPAKRGRVVYGGVVPYGELWRTGANAATQFRTDRALDFGGKVLPAGFYTLWTLPTAAGWKLVVNSETGQWGTEHKADKDVLTLDMKVGTLPAAVERFTIGVEPSATGGTLNLDWDTTRASVAFTVAAGN
jgi:hypothetical protein